MAELKFRDPIHNFIRFDAEEVELINLDVLQRLRGIRQLAMASLVYPARFIPDSIILSESLMSRVRWRTNFNLTLTKCDWFEDLRSSMMWGMDPSVTYRSMPWRDSRIGKLYLEDHRQEKIHEFITNHLIRNHHSVRRCLGQEPCDEIAKLLSMGAGEPVLRAIVSGPLDADKQDYLLRDSLFAGVNYGVFDIRQLQRSLQIHRDVCD